MAVTGSSNLQDKISPEKILQKLKHFFGYRERCLSEARKKLYSFRVSKEDAEALISRILEEGYINDERYALQFVSGKSRLKGWSRQKIHFELRRKGISELFIVNALKTLDEAEYNAGFNRLAAKKWASLRSEKNNFVRKSKWRLFLLQRGYEAALIKTWSFPEEI